MKRDQDLSAAIKENSGRLRSLIARKIGDQVEAEDIFQDVIAEFMGAYDLGFAIESMGSWLARVAQNKIVDRFRRKKTQSDYRDEVLARSSGESQSSDGPAEERARGIIRDEIADAIEQLPDDQREVFIKHELEGQSFEQISLETGVGVNTLLSRKRYAIQFLRKYLKEVYDELE